MKLGDPKGVKDTQASVQCFLIFAGKLGIDAPTGKGAKVTHKTLRVVIYAEQHLVHGNAGNCNSRDCPNNTANSLQV